jgi:hypothetical protein
MLNWVMLSTASAYANEQRISSGTARNPTAPFSPVSDVRSEQAHRKCGPTASAHLRTLAGCGTMCANVQFWRTDLAIARMLRATQIILGLCSATYVCWVFLSGRHVGDAGTGILIAMFLMSSAIGFATRRNDR